MAEVAPVSAGALQAALANAVPQAAAQQAEENAAWEARREATEEEEAFLASQEREQEMLLLMEEELGINDMGLDFMEDEDFDEAKELQEWESAQRMAELAAEAERAEGLPFDLDTLEAERDLDRQTLAQVLREGAHWLVDEGAATSAGYVQLLQAQYAAQQLLETVQRGLQLVVENERNQLMQEVAWARWEASYAAGRTRMELADANRRLIIAQAREKRLQEKLEVEKDRTSCKICYQKTKNALLLPCMHADYCLHCIVEHRKRKNTCPSCRTPISGTLECRPAQPDD